MGLIPLIIASIMPSPWDLIVAVDNKNDLSSSQV